MVIDSPLRYPGGKTKIYPLIKQTIDNNDMDGKIYCEPFTGGGGLALRLLYRRDVEKIIINDLDIPIYNLWYSILNYTNELIYLIEKTPITIEEWHNQKEIYMNTKDNLHSLESGFSTFFLNRTNVSGIISGGPIGGKNQTGKYKLDCRFNKDDLINKIEKIAQHKNQIDLYNFDAEYLIDYTAENYDQKSIFYYFDPPYFKQGESLYLSFFDINQHSSLANKILKLKDIQWVITYDTADEILELYDSLDSKYTYTLTYSANTKRKAQEFIFSSDITNLKSTERIKLESITSVNT